MMTIGEGWHANDKGGGSWNLHCIDFQVFQAAMQFFDLQFDFGFFGIIGIWKTSKIAKKKFEW